MEITPDDVEVRAGAHEELALAQGDGFAVALDTTLDDELRAEGIARELIRVINDTRRQRDFEIADRIELRLFATGRSEAAARRHRDWIAGEVLATAFVVVASEPPDGAVAVEVDGERVGVELGRS